MYSNNPKGVASNATLNHAQRGAKLVHPVGVLFLLLMSVIKGSSSASSTVETNIQGSGSVYTRIETEVNGEKKILEATGPGKYVVENKSDGNVSEKEESGQSLEEKKDNNEQNYGQNNEKNDDSESENSTLLGRVKTKIFLIFEKFLLLLKFPLDKRVSS